MRHVIEPTDLSTDELQEVIDLALDIIDNPAKYAEACKGKKLATLFYEPSTRTRLSFTSAMMDAVILTQQFVTLAELCGLGTCYLGTCLYNAPEIAELLKLPRLTVPVACISVGYPAEQPEPTERLALDGVLYHETYPELTDADIVEIYKAKNDFAPNAKLVAENGKKTLAQVFTDVRYPRAMNESVSDKLLAFLRRQRFLNE